MALPRARHALGSAVLRVWLGDTSLEKFRQEYLGRTALAKPSTGLADVSRLSWSVLDRIAECAAPRDVLIVANGAVIPMPPPRSLDHVRALFAAGVGLHIKHGERLEPALAELAASLTNDVGRAHVQIFATPGGTHGFGWHFDDEDVFIVQTEGTKDYYFRANTVTERPACAAAFATYHEERSALCAATLVPGDFLYIPARWWHMAIAKEDSLHISIGAFR